MMPRSAISFPLVAILLLWIVHPAAGAPTPADLEFFEKKIRPVLVNRCYECHGSEKQKGGLRLDSRESTLAGGDTGPALVPGKPEESLLITATSYTDLDLQMPPKNPLPAQEVELLREWVRRGAPDPGEDSPSHNPAPTKAPNTKFWSYLPPTQPNPPPVRQTTWPRGPIDQFILAKLEENSLEATHDADRATLLRRVYFDLIGLPPSAEEVDRFLADTSPRVFERVVDQLLASPHFGERWGRHWLDVARFAESVTLRGLVFPHAWRYRDYVIEAFNTDLPYDQFIREQLAGDLIESPHLEERQRGRVATTFLTLGNINYEEQDKAQLRMDIVDEQLDTLGKVFLAQTLGCARCHDHKFDPIPTGDYYAMAGILRNTKSVEHANVSAWIETPLPISPEDEAKFAQAEQRATELTAIIKEKKDALARLAPAPGVTTPIHPDQLPGIVVDDAQATKVGSWTASQHTKTYVGDGYIHDLNQDKGTKTVTFLPQLDHAGKYEVRLSFTAGENRAPAVPVTILHALGETVVTVNQQQAPPLDGRFISLGQFDFEKGNQAYVLVSNEGTRGHVIADAVQFIPVEMLPQLTQSTAAQEAEKAASAALAAEIRQLEAELKQHTALIAGRPMVMSVLEEQEISDTRIHIRGSVHSLGSEVPRGFLQAASVGESPQVPHDQSGRLQLADWIASPQNPLTARVMANRVWHWLFGHGIVRTTDNFGTTGALPTHPELLDYLALRLADQNWSIKSLIREIVLSRTYQLSSGANPGLVAADPANDLFARAERRRLEPEALRDAMLLLAGRLDLQPGGPTFPNGRKSDYGYLDGSTRRSVYVPVFRNALPEIFELFDFADPSMVTGQRNHSTAAPQALYFLNHPFVFEQAHATASRILAISGSDTERLRRLYIEALGRPPNDREAATAHRHLARFGDNDPNQEQAWNELCHALFASMDFQYIN